MPKDQDPASPCPECGGSRYWSDYWTDELVEICTRCIGEANREPRKFGEASRQLATAFPC